MGSYGFPIGGQFFFPSNEFTLPKANIAPENKSMEKEIPIGNHHYLEDILDMGSVTVAIFRVPSQKERLHF